MTPDQADDFCGQPPIPRAEHPIRNRSGQHAGLTKIVASVPHRAGRAGLHSSDPASRACAYTCFVVGVTPFRDLLQQVSSCGTRSWESACFR